MNKQSQFKKNTSFYNLSELGLVQKIISRVGLVDKLYGGIGDDVAVLKYSSDKWLLLTCDCLVEDIHFKPDWFDFTLLGRKAANINLSDIAAVGGVPKYALVSLGLPRSLKKNFIDDFYQGLTAEFSKVKVAIIGGNISSSAKIFLDIFLIGEIKPGLAVLRSKAKVGDFVLVTGSLGDAGLGLNIFKKGLGKDKRFKFLTKIFLSPRARLKEGQILARQRLASSMMDISDGLSGDTLKLCQASRVGVELWQDKLPISANLKTGRQLLNIDPFKIALQGGEDYELLFTCNQKNINKVKAIFQKEKCAKVSVIGHIKPLSFGKVVIDSRGRKSKLIDKSWDHFKK